LKVLIAIGGEKSGSKVKSVAFRVLAVRAMRERERNWNLISSVANVMLITFKYSQELDSKPQDDDDDVVLMEVRSTIFQLSLMLLTLRIGLKNFPMKREQTSSSISFNNNKKFFSTLSGVREVKSTR
jgi:hypothetical protein